METGEERPRQGEGATQGWKACRKIQDAGRGEGEGRREGCLALWTSPNHHPRPPLASLEGRPGDRVNLSCVEVSQPTRWVWAPSFPACKGLSKGRRRILWTSSNGNPTVSAAQPFVGRLRALGLGIRRLELLLSAGDSGTFTCKGHGKDESRTVLRVLGDPADCKAPEPTRSRCTPSGTRDLIRTHAPSREGGLDWGLLGGRASSLSSYS